MYNLFSGRFVLRSQFTLLSCKGWRCIVILSLFRGIQLLLRKFILPSLAKVGTVE